MLLPLKRDALNRLLPQVIPSNPLFDQIQNLVNAPRQAPPVSHNDQFALALCEHSCHLRQYYSAERPRSPVAIMAAVARRKTASIAAWDRSQLTETVWFLPRLLAVQGERSVFQVKTKPPGAGNARLGPCAEISISPRLDCGKIAAAAMTLEIITDAIVATISVGATDTAKSAIADADQSLKSTRWFWNGGGDQRLIKG
jgi:hypothetical protein